MLEVRNLSVNYGRHRALDGAGVTVGKGEICVILGANGAGKSTLLKTIAGMVRAEAGGQVLMNGRDLSAMKAHRIVEEGIALVPEGRGIFGDLTVVENLQLGAFARRARDSETETLARIYDLFPRLAERRRQVARTMSGGEQQMVAIGRALMSKPEILMLDEPSLGLSPLLSQELFRSLKAVAETGVGILLVEQNAKQSLRIAGRGYLLENGHVTGEGSAQALMNDPAVVNAYLGGPAMGGAGRTRIELPAPMRLPASVGAMGRALGDFAARAGRISQAFVRAVRRDGALPSAFVGRYDPKSGGDPWQQVAQASRADARPFGNVRPAMVSSAARQLGDGAPVLATRAAERLAEHVRTRRLSSPRPGAFAASYASPVAPMPEWRGGPVGEVAHGGSPVVAESPRAPIAAPPATTASIADLAARAAAIQAAHVATLRARRTGSVAPQPPVLQEPPRVNASHGLIGHNSAGLEMEEPEVPEAAAPGISISDLAARAAEIHARHVAERRTRVSAMVTPPPAGYGASPAAFRPAEVREPAREAAPGTIGELVARAASIQSSHVAAGRKRLAAFTIPVPPPAGHGKMKSASDKRKKHKET